MRARIALLAAGLATLAATPAAHAEGAPSSCPGDPIRVDQAITGEFGSALQGSYVLVPFDVPAGTTSVRVKYCFDQPEVPTPNVRHTLDLGIYEPLRGGEHLPGVREFRGW